MRFIYNKLVAAGCTPAGACGLLGNLFAESQLQFNVVERLCLQRLKEKGKVYDDESYTAAVDSGKISRAEFLHPLPGKQYGYGICQWTHATRKAKLYDSAKTYCVSIADPDLQIDYLVSELRSSYPGVWRILNTTDSVREASDAVLHDFESPANQSVEIEKLRAGYGYMYYDDYVKEDTMAVIIGSARSNEKGGLNGGSAGDQTGGEVSTQNWYLHSKGWVVLRPKYTTDGQIIAQTMQDMCDNQNIGYCQDHRLTAYNAAKNESFVVKNIKTKVEVDCSEAVRICLAAADIMVPDFNTATEVTTIMNTGRFLKLDTNEYCKVPDNLKVGDILVTKTKGHTVVVVRTKNNNSGLVEVGWHKDDVGWWYVYDKQGHWYKNEWVVINHHWYLFNSNGYMQTGWVQWDGKNIGEGDWYYLDTTIGDTEGQCWHEKAGGKGILEPWYVE